MTASLDSRREPDGRALSSSGSVSRFRPWLPLLLLLFPVAQAGCELLGDTSVPDWETIDEIGYSAHVQFLLDEYCTRCHDSGGRDAGLDLSSWDALMAGSDFGEAVIPFDAGRSRLYRMVTHGVGGDHPDDVGSDTLTSAQVSVLRRWIEEGARDDAGRVFGADAGNRVYVAGSGDASIWVIDPVRMVVVRVIDLVDLQFAPTARPGFVVASPDGSALYASVEGENVVLRFNRAGDLVGIADVMAPGPLSVSADGKILAVGRSSGEQTGIVSIETDAMRPTVRGAAFQNAHAVAIRPQADFVLAVDQLTDQVVTIPLAGGTERVFELRGRRHVADQAIFTSSGSRAFITGASSGQLVVLEAWPDGSMTQSAAVDVAAFPVQPAISADGQLVAVASATGAVTLLRADDLGIVRTTSHTSIIQPEGVTFAEGRILVSGRNRRASYRERRSFGGSSPGTVTVIDVDSGAILRVLEVGVDPTSMTSGPSN